MKKPDIRDVRPEDLSDIDRLEVLHRQAAERGFVNGSECDVLRFVSAAERAKAVKDGDAVRVFMGIVRKGLWHHVTLGQEDQARAKLARYRSESPGAFQTAKGRVGQVTIARDPDFRADPPMSPDEVRRLVRESLGLEVRVAA